MRGHVLLKDMILVGMSFVLHEDRFYRMHVLQEGMYYMRTCVKGVHHFHVKISYGRTCLIGIHVLQAGMSSEDKSCRRACLVRSHVLWGTCLMRGHVLQKDMSYSKT